MTGGEESELRELQNEALRQRQVYRVPSPPMPLSRPHRRPWQRVLGGLRSAGFLVLGMLIGRWQYWYVAVAIIGFLWFIAVHLSLLGVEYDKEDWGRGNE